MAGLGYTVHLRDPVARLVAEARRRSAAAVRALASCQVGDARYLEVAGSTADFVLLLGPLYHLTDPGDRLLALREAARVLKPGGWLFAAAISRWAALLRVARLLETETSVVGASAHLLAVSRRPT